VVVVLERWEVGVTGVGGHLCQMAHNSNRVIPTKGPRNLKNDVNATTALFQKRVN
jgi:hypothetical protein